MMEQIVTDERVIAAVVVVLLALLGVITEVVRTVGAAAVQYIRERTGLTQEVRRRALAEDVVAAVEQMAGRGWSGNAKREAAMDLAREHGMTLAREEIEAALKRQQGWNSGWLAAMEPRAEGSD